MKKQTTLAEIAAKADIALAEQFSHIDRVSFENTKRVLAAFAEHRVSAAHLAPSDGYGYGDRGRDDLDSIYASVFGTEAALVRCQIVSGTHAIAIGLFGLLRPGDKLLSVTGTPYDTLNDLINSRENQGSLADFGVSFAQIELIGGEIDYPSLKAALADRSIKAVHVQRSRGYSDRPTLTVEKINTLADFVHQNSDAYVVVDNCYGEFTETAEPAHADLIIGSLIKNAGGGMADTGGYLAGTKKAVELASYRLTSPGIGSEVGASLGQNKNFYRGFFYAPHTVAQALKTAHFAAYIFDFLGAKTSPAYTELRSDIIQTVTLDDPKLLCAFCSGIQQGSPIDAYVTPEPWEMPGYEDKVIMAAGTFVGGASIELSADGPLRPPYTAFFQGGLTYESGKIGILSAAEALIAARADKLKGKQ